MIAALKLVLRVVERAKVLALVAALITLCSIDGAALQAGQAPSVQSPPLSPDQQAKLAEAQSDYDAGFSAYQAGNYALAEAKFRTSYQIGSAILGSENPGMLRALNNLAIVIDGQGRHAEAENLDRQLYEIRVRVLGADNPETLAVLANLGITIMEQGRFAEAETFDRRLYEAESRVQGPEHPDTLSTLNNLAIAVDQQGRYAEAEALTRQLYETRVRIQGAEHPDTLSALANLVGTILQQSRYAEAEQLDRQLYETRVRVLGAEHPATLSTLNNLAVAIEDQGRYAEAANLFMQLYQSEVRIQGAIHPDTLSTLANLANAFADEDRFADAEKLDRLLFDARAQALGADHPDTLRSLASLMIAIDRQGRYAEAEKLARQVYEAERRVQGSEHPDTLWAATNAARVFREQRENGEAVSAYEPACKGLTRRALESARSALLGQRADAASVTSCNLGWALSLWGLGTTVNVSAIAAGVAPVGPGNVKPEALGDAALGFMPPKGFTPASLKSDAFAAAQSAEQSAAGDALSQKASLIAASVSGEGRAASDYELAIAARESLEDAFTKAASDTSPNAAALRRTITAEIAETESNITRLADELSRQAPLYWDYRSPSPVSIEALQAAKTRDRPELLHGDEALVLWMFAPGDDKGLVFAVSREKSAWAEMGLSGRELTEKVQALRKDIDPLGYGTRSADTENSRAVLPSFDRQSAFELYQVLLGNHAIQDVIAAKSTLVIVPSGPLTSLPPSLLIESAPTGNDDDPEALRNTQWLIRDKAIAVLPTVSSLRTLRQLFATNRQSATIPLLELADPDFRGDGRIPAANAGQGRRSVALRADAAETDGRSKQEVLASLPPLGGTLREAQLLKTSLHAPEDSLLLGPRASKTELDMRKKDGRLAKVNVLGFATHGLVTGDFSGLTEPALALAHPGPHHDPGDDGLLKASDAATLKLNADWVVLSACNTASPDAPDAQGISGLARAFFYAGARSLLVSHWRVRDDAAERLVTETFRLQHGGRPTFRPDSPFAGPNKNPSIITKAQALRIAMLELLEDSSKDDSTDAAASFANPAAWAPFVVIGEDR